MIVELGLEIMIGNSLRVPALWDHILRVLLSGGNVRFTGGFVDK